MIIYIPVNPSFTIYNWGVRGSTIHGLVSMMNILNLLLYFIDVDECKYKPCADECECQNEPFDFKCVFKVSKEICTACEF